jgi:hypothetical protein
MQRGQQACNLNRRREASFCRDSSKREDISNNYSKSRDARNLAGTQEIVGIPENLNHE